jgi:hypothetical protein
VDELVQTSTEVSRAMYLTCSSLLHHFIVCSTPSPTQRNPSPHSTDFCPRDESIYPACWAYIFSVVSIYTYYAEYIDPSANLRKLNAQNRFYRPISEADTQSGYVDIFLSPMLEIYPDMSHSYIIELKYARYKDPESRVEELRAEAIAQTNRYADTDRVKNAIGTTQLHKIVVVYKGMEMRVCEEVNS